MNRLCIITTKVPKINGSNFSNLLEYQNELTSCVKTFPGYINSISYWKQEEGYTNFNHKSYNVICNISNWESLDYWNSWLSSDKRLLIQNKFNECIQNENHELLYQRHNFSDTPLL